MEHFCYLLRNGLGNKTCLIPLGIILFFYPQTPFFMLKLSPSLFFVLKTLPFFLIGQFLALLLNFSPTSVPKNLFLFLSSAAACFCWPKKSFFSLKLLSFWTLFSNFFPIFGPKILFFFLSSAPACFFWPEMSFFFSFLRIGQFLAFKLNFYQNFCPKKTFFCS